MSRHHLPLPPLPSPPPSSPSNRHGLTRHTSLHMIHIALVRPAIPFNTGSVGRLALGFNSRLHLVKPLGFDISDSQVKKAGLDYWKDVDLIVHNSPAELLCTAGASDLFYISKAAVYGSTPLEEAQFYSPTRPPSRDIFLVFGNESSGLTSMEKEVRAAATDHRIAIPMSNKIRSYNLANSVSMVLFEAFRQQKYWLHEKRLID